MNALILKLGLKPDDFTDEINSTDELIENILTSGRLFRKAIQHIVIKELSIYFMNPQLDSTETLKIYFKQWGRKRQWRQFKESMNMKVPDLQINKLAQVLMVSYFIGYVFGFFKLVYENINFIAHMHLSGISISTIAFFGLLIPLAIMYGLGRTALPAKTIEGLVDKIIQENMYDLLVSDKRKLRGLLIVELGSHIDTTP